MPVKSAFPDVNVPLIDTWTYYMEQPVKYPIDEPIFIDSDTGRSYSYANIKELATEFGKGLRHVFKWNTGDVVGFYTPNNIDIPALNFGIHWAGGIASPANPTYTAEELAQQLKDSGAKVLLTQKAFLETARKAAETAKLPLDRILLLGDERDETGTHKHWTEITAKSAWIQPKRPVIDPKKDVAYLVYSSGTTGLPKGVMLTHYNLVGHSYQVERLDPNYYYWDMDAQLGVLPLFHIYGLSFVLHVTLYSGMKCIVMSKFDMEKACKLIQDYRITVMYVPPPIVLGLGKHPVVDKYDLSSLRSVNSAAAPLSLELVIAVWERLKIGVRQGYGLSETSPVVAAQIPDDWRKYQGSVGRLLPNIEAKIVDEDGKELGPDQPGELLLRGPNVFGGYWKRPDLHKETFTEDGWYKTGDISYICPRGNLYITDRKKELIKYNGFQVAPAELEAKIIGRKDVADVCVIGVWNKEQHTEVPRAYVVLKTGVEETEEKAKEITDWLNSEVAPSKRLRGGVRFIKEVPKSQAGKILRRVLRDQTKVDEDAQELKAKL